MSNSHLNAQLEQLQAILGKPVRLDSTQTHRPKPTAAPGGNHAPNWEDEHFDFKTGSQSHISSIRGSEEATTAAKPSAAYKDIDSADLKIGEPVDDEIAFCPWNAAVHYPERFIGKANKPRAQPFFDKILEGKTWDFFYLHDLNNPDKQPCLLVPTIQFVRFLEGINTILNTELVIPYGINQRLFNLHFGVGGTPRPRYLQRSRDQKHLSIDEYPLVNEADVKAFKASTDVHRELWLSSWERTKKHSYPDKQGGSHRAERNREARRQMLSETQLYLGLQGRRDPPGKPVVFITIDVEAIEVAPNPVSEIGIAVLDMKRLGGVVPGSAAENWWKFIEAHHLRVKEYAGLVNYRFVQGCPRNFDFGTSVIIPQKELIDTLSATITKYAKGSHDVVLVGHDIQADIQYLSSIGFQTDSIPGRIGNIDTQGIYRAWKDDQKARSLGNVLHDLGITYKNLHNAGNDAVYTLRAMAAIAVASLQSSQDKEPHEQSQE